MSLSKLISRGLLFLSISGISSIAVASTNLSITNNTDFPSTAYINGFACSSGIGDKGITKPHSTNTIESSLLSIICLSNPHSCSADIYLSSNCTGAKIASGTFDTSKGVIPGSIHIYDQAYSIIAAGFSVTLNKR